jgi:hypothetical protein
MMCSLERDPVESRLQKMQSIAQCYRREGAEHHQRDVLEIDERLWWAHAVGLLQVERLLVSLDATDHDCVSDFPPREVLPEDFAVNASHCLSAIPQSVNVIRDDILHAELPGHLTYRIRDVHDNYLDVFPEDGSTELESLLA